jgi:hypothetical protein
VPDPPDWRELIWPALILVIGLVVTVPTVVGLGLAEDRADRVQAEGVLTTATVVKVRQWVGFGDMSLRYEQGGRSWTVHRGTNDSTPSGLGVGDAVLVWVDPKDPGWASATELDPLPGWGNTLVFIGFFVGGGTLLLGLPMFVGVLTGQLGAALATVRYRRRQRRERVRGPSSGSGFRLKSGAGCR